MNKIEKRDLIVSYLNEILPNASCELEYSKDYELLIAVMLSAQTTDKSVNKVTRIMFKEHPTLDSLGQLNELDIYNYIKTLGLANNKAKNVYKTIQLLINDYDSKVPNDFNTLTSFPGVGIKTANVVQAELFSRPVIAVDTHVERVSKRLGLALKKDSPLIVEKKLEKLFLEKDRVKLHHQLIHFGRYYCKSLKPQCENCKLKQICKLNIK